MLPKLKQPYHLLKNNPKGAITSLNELDAALEGKVGTVIKSKSN